MNERLQPGCRLLRAQHRDHSCQLSPPGRDGEPPASAAARYSRLEEVIYSIGHSWLPSLMASMTSCGSSPSILQPTERAVPSISRIVPWKFFDRLRGCMTRPILMISSKETLPL